MFPTNSARLPYRCRPCSAAFHDVADVGLRRCRPVAHVLRGTRTSATPTQLRPRGGRSALQVFEAGARGAAVVAHIVYRLLSARPRVVSRVRLGVKPSPARSPSSRRPAPPTLRVYQELDSRRSRGTPSGQTSASVPDAFDNTPMYAFRRAGSPLRGSARGVACEGAPAGVAPDPVIVLMGRGVAVPTEGQQSAPSTRHDPADGFHLWLPGLCPRDSDDGHPVPFHPHGRHRWGLRRSGRGRPRRSGAPIVGDGRRFGAWAVFASGTWGP